MKDIILNTKIFTNISEKTHFFADLLGMLLRFDNCSARESRADLYLVTV